MGTTIKTAISIDAEIFEKVEKLTRKLHISRSQFFAQAAQYMITKDEKLELLRRINEAYDSDPMDASRRKAEKQYARKSVIEKW